MTDRLSAFDVILPDPIPSKGAVLNQLSAFWFKRFNNIDNHFITADFDEQGRPVVIRPAKFERRLTPWGEAKALQRPLPDGSLQIVATGEKEDPALAA